MAHWLFAAWALLAAIQLGWLPFARHAWAFDLWAYLPVWAAWALGATSLALCAPRVRDAIAAGFAALARRVRRGPAVEAVAALAVAALLWALRERPLTGDSAVLVAAAHAGHSFVFPEVGATFLLRSLLELGRELGLRPVESMRVLSCASGGIAVFLLLRVARELVPGWSAAAV